MYGGSDSSAYKGYIELIFRDQPDSVVRVPITIERIGLIKSLPEVVIVGVDGEKPLMVEFKHWEDHPLQIASIECPEGLAAATVESMSGRCLLAIARSPTKEPNVGKKAGISTIRVAFEEMSHVAQVRVISVP